MICESPIVKDIAARYATIALVKIFEKKVLTGEKK